MDNETLKRIEQDARNAYPVHEPQPGWTSDGEHNQAQERRQYAYKAGAISERNKAIQEAMDLFNQNLLPIDPKSDNILAIAKAVSDIYNTLSTLKIKP